MSQQTPIADRRKHKLAAALKRNMSRRKSVEQKAVANETSGTCEQAPAPRVEQSA